MKYLIRIILLLLIMSGCHRNNTVTIELFNPNPLLKPVDIYRSNFKPFPIDMDEMFEFVNNDTIIRINLSKEMIYDQYWLIPIYDAATIDDVELFFKQHYTETINNIELFFEQHYDVITLSRDTITYDDYHIIGIKAYSKRNKLYFNYHIDICECDREKEMEICVIVSYTFPEYKSYLLDQQLTP